MSRPRAFGLYLALTVPFGIAVHLIAEFAGLGPAALQIAVSPLHAYLGILASGALAVLACYGRATPDLRRRLPLFVRALPFGGRGGAFFVVSAVAQFGFFAVTQVAEGSPLRGGDAAIGVLAAVLAAAIGAFALSIAGVRLVHCGDRATRAPRRSRAIRAAHGLVAPPAALPIPAFLSGRGNRPPPLQTIVR